MSKQRRRKICDGLWQLNKNEWAMRAQRICPHTGKKLNRKRMLHGVTQAQALEVLSELHRELDSVCQGLQPAPPPVTSQETLGRFAQSWLAKLVDRDELASSTQKRYATALDKLSPNLRARLLSELAPNDVEQWMTASLGVGTARSTVNARLRVLRTCLSSAVRDGRLVRNPAQQVRALREDVNLVETNSLTPDELAKLLPEIEKQDFIVGAMSWVMALTGIRLGEATALRWEEYDEPQGIIIVRRSVSDREFRALTKTRRARIVGVPASLASKLRGYQAELVRKQHVGLQSGLMFPGRRKEPRPISAGHVSDVLRAACEAAGIEKRFTSHGFRRSLTDLLRQAHVDPVVAAGLTGHETERMRKHYSTVRANEARDAGERVAVLVQPCAESRQESRAGVPSPLDEKGQLRATS